MKFIKTNAGQINCDCIVRVENEFLKARIVYFDGEDVLQAWTEDLETLDQLGGSPVAALPGYQVLFSNYEDKTYELYPIIAWQINPRGWPTPVTVLGPDHGGSAIVLPDGRVEIQGDRSWPDIQAYIEKIGEPEAK